MPDAFKGTHLALKAFRERVKKSQTEMARELGIAQSTYAHYESKDDVVAPLDILHKLARMGLNLHWLLTGAGGMLVGKSDEGVEPGISSDHIVEAYVLTKAGLGKHSMPSALSEARLVAHVAEGLSKGLTQDQVLQEFEDGISKTKSLRNHHRK